MARGYYTLNCISAAIVFVAVSFAHVVGAVARWGFEQVFARPWIEPRWQMVPLPALSAVRNIEPAAARARSFHARRLARLDSRIVWAGAAFAAT